MESAQSNTSKRLKPGLSYELKFIVEGELLTDVEGTLQVPVLSTPAMIGRMERAATRCVNPLLTDGFTTVGFEVNVRHVASAKEGAHCVAVARLAEIVDGRKLRFTVEVTGDGRTVGVGSHERRVVPTVL